MKSNYTQKVELFCPNCRSKNFEYDTSNENSLKTCTSCKKQFTNDQLLKSNKRNIENNFKKLGEEAMKDFANDIKKVFSNSKYFKV